jgi:hypothetical protein
MMTSLSDGGGGGSIGAGRRDIDGRGGGGVKRKRKERREEERRGVAVWAEAVFGKWLCHERVCKLIRSGQVRSDRTIQGDLIPCRCRSSLPVHRFIISAVSTIISIVARHSNGREGLYPNSSSVAALSRILPFSGSSSDAHISPPPIFNIIPS